MKAKRICVALTASWTAIAVSDEAFGQSIGLDGSVAPDVAVSHDSVDPNRVIVGLGVGVNPDYEGSEDYRLVPLWLLRVNDLYAPETYAQIFGTQLKTNFLPDPNWRFGLSGQFVPERDDVDNNRVDDLSSASESLMFGVVAGYDAELDEMGTFGVEIDARQDVINNNGYLVTGSLDYGRVLSRQWRLSSGLSTTYASSNYMENYFGIDSGNAARSGLDEYDADAGFKDASFRLGVDYSFTESWSTSLIGQYKRLLNDAKDSPITDDEGDANQWFTGITVNYAF